MDECQGLLVTHLDGRVECLDDECLTPDAPRHEWRAACEDVQGLCDCSVDAITSDRQWAAA